MTQNEISKVKVTLGSLQFEYEGREDFLKSDILAFVQQLDKLQAHSLIGPVSSLQADIERSLTAHRDVVETDIAVRGATGFRRRPDQCRALRLAEYSTRRCLFRNARPAWPIRKIAT